MKFSDSSHKAKIIYYHRYYHGHKKTSVMLVFLFDVSKIN